MPIIRSVKFSGNLTLTIEQNVTETTTRKVKRVTEVDPDWRPCSVSLLSRRWKQLSGICSRSQCREELFWAGCSCTQHIFCLTPLSLASLNLGQALSSGCYYGWCNSRTGWWRLQAERLSFRGPLKTNAVKKKWHKKGGTVKIRAHFRH